MSDKEQQDQPLLARRIAQLVARSAITCHYVRAYDHPDNCPNSVRQHYEDWLEASIKDMIEEDMKPS